MLPVRTFRKQNCERFSQVSMTALLCVGLLAPLPSNAQSLSPPALSTQPPTRQGVEVDRVIALVNDDVILESDVDEERRLTAFQPFRDNSRNSSREQVIDRLINRSLILQQSKIQEEGLVTDKQVQDQLDALKKAIPACRDYHCETEAGWQHFVGDQGFTLEELQKLWRERMEVLNFIEIRFRSGIIISDSEIQDYYDKTLLPQYAKQKAAAPKVSAIRDRIQEILLQQQVGNLLGDWLKSLRAQGVVRSVQQGEASQ
jgi:peptidyl-prolyl cis-trans isomerase SurA